MTGTSEQPKPRRGPGKPFVKGDPRIQPGGVPKWLAAIKREMESLGPEAVHFIAGVMRGEIKDAKVTIEGERYEVVADMSVRVKCGELLIKYSLPPPKQEIGTSGDGLVVVVRSYKDSDELAETSDG